MVISNATQQAACEVADLVIKILERVIEIDHHQLLVGASVGIAPYPRDGDDVQTLMQHADVAMYEAKKSRSGYAIYNAAYSTPLQRRLFEGQGVTMPHTGNSSTTARSVA